MIYYYVLFILILLMSLCQIIRQLKSLRLVFVLAAFLLLWLFAGLRYPTVGVDGWGYVRAFERIPDLYFWFNGDFAYRYLDWYMEFNYVFLNGFIKLFTNNYTVLFLSIAFLAIGLNIFNYYKYSKYTLLTILLYFSHTFLYRDIGQIRAGIACAIGLFLVSQIHKKQHIRIVMTIFMASLFHMAALSLLLVYFFSFFELTRKRLVLAILFSLIIGAGGTKAYVESVSPYLGTNISRKLSNHLSTERFSTDLGVFNITNVKNLFLLFLLLLFWMPLSRALPYFKTVALFLVLATCWRIAFNDFATLAGRVATFYSIVEVLFLSGLLSVVKQKVFVAFCIVLYAFFIFYLNITIKDIVSPYSFSIF